MNSSGDDQQASPPSPLKSIKLRRRTVMRPVAKLADSRSPAAAAAAAAAACAKKASEPTDVYTDVVLRGRGRRLLASLNPHETTQMSLEAALLRRMLLRRDRGGGKAGASAPADAPEAGGTVRLCGMMRSNVIPRNFHPFILRGAPQHVRANVAEYLLEAAPLRHHHYSDMYTTPLPACVAPAFAAALCVASVALLGSGGSLGVLLPHPFRRAGKGKRRRFQPAACRYKPTNRLLQLTQPPAAWAASPCVEPHPMSEEAAAKRAGEANEARRRQTAEEGRRNREREADTDCLALMRRRVPPAFSLLVA